jgi:Protein of function (DUF2518)
MFTPESLLEYAKYSGIATVLLAGMTVLGLILAWGFKFRLVGITGFMTVLTVGLFGLSLGLAPRIAYPGAVRYSVIYDNGNSQAVVAVANSRKLTHGAIEATLQQAAQDLYSFGRVGETDGSMHIRLRSINHPQPGVSEPIYLGEATRNLTSRDGAQLQIVVNDQNLAKLSG